MSSRQDPPEDKSLMRLLHLCAQAAESSRSGDDEHKDTSSSQPSQCGTVAISSSLPGTMVISSSQESPQLSQQSQSEQAKKAWLEDALNTMFARPVEAMMKCIRNLNATISEITSSDSVPQDAYETLELHLESLMQYTDVIDNANDFFNIGGFTILEPLLQMPHSGVRAKCLELIGDLVQNNKFCQDKIAEAGLLPQLFHILDSEEEEESVCVKALYAISCLCRQNESVVSLLAEIDGFSVLLRTIQKPSDRLRTKCAFLLTHFCNHMPEVQDVLYNMGIVQLLACLLQDEVKPSTEHILSCLLALVSHHQESKTELLKPEHQIKSTILTLTKAVQDLPEYREIKDYLKDLSMYCYDENLDEAEKNCEETERFQDKIETEPV